MVEVSGNIDDFATAKETCNNKYDIYETNGIISSCGGNSSLCPCLRRLAHGGGHVYRYRLPVAMVSTLMYSTSRPAARMFLTLYPFKPRPTSR